MPFCYYLWLCLQEEEKPWINKIYSDELLNGVKSILHAEKLTKPKGCPVVPFRKVLDGILYVLRTESRWKMLLKEYGSGSTYHRQVQDWVVLNIFYNL